MRQKPSYPEIFAASFALILVEIAFTRVFSFKFFYFFTYLILGIALLGLGAGGILVAVSSRLKKSDARTLVASAAFAGGASVVAVYFLVAETQLNTSRLSVDAGELLVLVAICSAMTLPFLLMGIVITTILSSRPEAAARLYGTDLLGAALGCALAIPLLEALDPPRTLVLAAVVLSAAGLRVAVDRRLLAAGLVTTAALSVPLVNGRLLPDPKVDASLSYEEFRQAGLVRFSKWNPVFRIDVVDLPFSRGNAMMIFHDGDPGSGLRRYTGNPADFLHLLRDARSLPFVVLPKGPRVLVIGSAGGHEVVASLVAGASHVTGVELNPVTLSLLRDQFADFTGRLYENPRVRFVNGDARWFLAHDDNEYDLVWWVAPDSYSAMNAASSGAMVLSESYLYTVEALRSALHHLAPRGVLCAQFGEIDYARKPNRSARFVSTAREAFRREGIADLAPRALVASGAGLPPQLDSVIVLAKEPFAPDQIQRFVEQTSRIELGALRYAPNRPSDVTPVNQIIVRPLAQLGPLLALQPYRLEPVVDDSPFFWHFASFGAALGSQLSLSGGLIDYEDAVGEKVILVLFAVATVLAAIFLFLPFVRVKDEFEKMPGLALASVYFAALGIGFMFVEVVLIQRLTLFLGYPTYSLSVTLFALLVFSGCGALLSGRLGTGTRSTWALFVTLGAILLAHRAALPRVMAAFLGASLAVRITIAVAAIAPLGLCLGAFLPRGIRAIAPLGSRPREYVAWAWAVNGFFSVIGSVTATIFAMTIGYERLLLVALAIYAVASVALSALHAKSKSEIATEAS